MVEMSREYADQGVRFVSLLLEAPDDTESIAWSNAFLAKQDADFDHFRIDNDLMDTFEQMDLLGIPVVLVYNSEGKLAAKLTGDDPADQFDEDDVRNAIESLLDGQD